MKKFLQNRKLSEIQCYTCNEKCMKPTSDLDRIDSSKGYVKGNIEFVCLGINYLKSNFSKEQVITFLTNFKNSDFSEDRTISSLENQALDALGSP